MAADLDNLQQFETWASAFLDKLSPAARRKLAMDLGNKLRRSQAERIKAQQAPDGSAFEARKKPSTPTLRRKKGAIKRRAMFSKLSTSKFLKVVASSEEVSVGFFGRVARIARVHQEGLSDTVMPSGKAHQYPARVLLGFSRADREIIRDTLLQQLAD